MTAAFLGALGMSALTSGAVKGTAAGLIDRFKMTFSSTMDFSPSSIVMILLCLIFEYPPGSYRQVTLPSMFAKGTDRIFLNQWN